MRLHIVSPALPPQLDGIGDYTAQLAAELAGSAEVTVLTDHRANPLPIPGVTIVPCFSTSQPRSMRFLATQVRDQRPDWLVLQYNPFAYGRWGFNLHLPLAIGSIRHRLEGTRVAVMFHEVFTPAVGFKFVVMTTWQRAQLLALGRVADSLFFALEQWTTRFGRWFPGKQLTHLPVGSNIPRVEIGREEARERLGIGPEKVVLGFFGRAHPSRLLELTHRSAEAVRDAGHDVLVLYIGPDARVIEEAIAGLPLQTTTGAVTAEEVSRRLAAIDVYLAAFVDGVSTRRGSLMAGLQHGIPTVGTSGPLTDSVFRSADGQALLLAPADLPESFCNCVLRLVGDGELRREVGTGAEKLYTTEFSWPTLAKRLVSSLAKTDTDLGAAGPPRT